MNMVNLKSKYDRHKLAVTIVIALVLGGIAVLLGIVLDRKTSAESVSIQVMQLILATCAAILPTRVLAQRQESEISKNRAKMALRRTLTLVNQMDQVAQHIEMQRDFIGHESSSNKMVKESLVLHSLDTISDLHKLQYAVINDISNDWRDVIPEEFDKLQQAQGQKKGD